MTFRVGQKIVCINDDGFNDHRWCFNYPVKGEVYTVRELVTGPRGVPSIRLIEIKNRVGFSDDGSMRGEPCFTMRRFRPVVKKKTDIGFAHEILRKASRTKETVASGRARDRAICPAVARSNEGRAA